MLTFQEGTDRWILSLVYPKDSWSLDVKRCTSLNHRQAMRLDMGVCSRKMTQPSGTSGERRGGKAEEAGEGRANEV